MKLLRVIIVTLICASVSGMGVLKANSFMWQITAIIATGFVGAATTSVYEFIDTHGQGLKTWLKSQITH